MLKPNLDYKFYDEDGAKRFRELSEKGLVTAFLYSDKIYKECRNETLFYKGLPARMIAKGGVVYSPVSLFERLYDASVELKGDKATITYCEKSVTVDTLVDREIIYINPLVVAKALDISATLLYENRLLALGDAELISSFSEDADAIQAAAYITLGEYDPFKFTSEDFKRARHNWKVAIVGSPEYNDLSNPAIKEKCEIASKQCKLWWEKMNKGEDRVILWGDAAPTESCQLGTQYSRLACMARAYGMYGSDYYLNEELRKDIVEGIQWMYENMYGEAEMEGRGWRNPFEFNFWDWYIPSPTYMTEIFFILEDSFTLEERRKYLRFYEWYANQVRNNNSKDESMGRIGAYTQVALATEKPVLLLKASMDFDILLTLYETGEGPHIDYVHWAHRMPYNNAYGVMHLERALRVYSCLFGTGVEFKSPKLYNQFMFAKYMFEPTMRNGQAMTIMKGRQTEVSETSTCASITWQLMRLYGLFGTDEDEYLANILRRQASNERCLRNIKDLCTIPICVLVDKLLSEKNDAPVYEYAHSWFTADRAVQHRREYSFALALSSYREPSFESINWVNINGWHMGDGATYLYTGYDQCQYDKENSYLTNKRIAYTYPGTTEDEREREEKGISYSNTYYSTNEIAGTMQIMDKYIIAGMDFVSYNVDTKVENEEFNGGGGKKPYHLNDLVARKAYFALDDIIVCLGAGINSTMSSPVNTTIEHRRIVNKESDKLYINGELMPSENFEKCYTGSTFFLLEGHSAFEILDNSTLKITRYTSLEAASQDYIEVKVLHGENPCDEKYAYAIYPTAKYISADDRLNERFEIISNTSVVQALKSNTLGFTSYVFYECGECGVISSDGPSLVTIVEKEDTVTLMVSDPTHKRVSGKFILDGEYYSVESSSKLSVNTLDGKTEVIADFDAANGRTYSITLKK